MECLMAKLIVGILVGATSMLIARGVAHLTGEAPPSVVLWATILTTGIIAEMIRRIIPT